MSDSGRYFARTTENVVPVRGPDPRITSGVAEGAQALGGALGDVTRMRAQTEDRVSDDQFRIAQIEDERALAKTTTDKMVEFDAVQARIDAHDLELRQAMPSGGSGYEAALAEFRDEQWAAFGNGLSDERVLQRFQPMVARAMTTSAGQAQRTALAAFARKQGQDAEDFADRIYNSARGDRSNDNMELIGDKIGVFLDGLGPMPEDDRESLRHAFTGRALVGAAEGEIEADPASALARINSGQLDEYLPAQQLEALRTHAEAEQRRREAQAAAAEAAAVRQQREALDTQQVELDGGAGTAQDYFALAQGYEAIGDTSTAARNRAKAGQRAAVQDMRAWSQPRIRGAIQELEAERDPTPEQAARLAGARDLYSQNETRLNKPGGALAQYVFATGETLAPIEASQPETLRARARIAQDAAREAGRGRIEPLLPDEIAGLQELAEGSPAEQMQALEAIAGFDDPATIFGAAHQIASGDGKGGFRIAASLIQLPHGAGRTIAREILNGHDATDATGGAYIQASARALWNPYLPALSGMGADYAADTFEAARAIYATRMQRAGKATWDAAMFTGAIESAIGRYGTGTAARGGTAEYRGERVRVPTGWTGNGVFGRIARMTGDDMARARVSGPARWLGGAPAYTGQLRELIPVNVGGTRYQFASPRTGRLLPAEGGDNYELDLAKVPWRD